MTGGIRQYESKRNKTMKGFPTLTLKRILKRQKKNPQDKELHKVIETRTVEEKEFNTIIEKAAKQEQKPAAQVLRELLAESIRAKVKTQSSGRALKGLAKLGEKLQIRGPKELSTAIDKYLYDE